jgi:hypothetical protein
MVSNLAIVKFVILPDSHGPYQNYHAKIDRKKPQIPGSIDAGRDIYRRFGLRGLYLGFNATFLR